MVLTLQTTVTEGSIENNLKDRNTLNEADIGQASSVSKQPKVSPKLSQPSELSMREPVVPNHVFRQQQDAAVAETLSKQPLEPAPIQAKTKEVELSADQSEQEIQQGTTNDDSQQNLELVLAKTSELSAPAKGEVQNQALVLQISPKLQAHIERKIQDWAGKIVYSESHSPLVSWRHKGQTLVAEFTHLPAQDDMGLDELLVEVRTAENGQALSTTLRLKRLAFSNFAQFVHRWDPQVLMHDDEMDGRFHSNSQILLAADRKTKPVFHDKVTTASRRVEFAEGARRSMRQQIFKGGLETGVKRILMPKPKRVFTNQAPAPENTITFREDTRLVFNGAGGILSFPANQPDKPQLHHLLDRATYLIAEPNVTLSVQGSVAGKVMVYSPKQIIIEGDLTYADSNFLDGTDVIGLVSDGNVVIADQETTGEGDLTVQASIYAKRRFLVRGYNSRNSGVLKLFGSISAGSVGATEPRYATSLKFDPRFEKLRPPGFILTNQYEVIDSPMAWQLEDS